VAQKDLIPISSTARAKELGSKGGRVKSLKKKYAAKLREMKKRGLKSADIDWFVKRLEDPEANILELQKWIDEVKESVHPSQRVALINTSINLHKAHHGEKKHITGEMVHHVLNWGDILKDAEVQSEETSERDIRD